MPDINYESYKASGIYFVEVYDNETYTFPLISGRLVMGSSRIGPMNAAVSLADPQQKNRTYGNGDSYLENRGSFFHQALDTALLEGPIFGLNVLPVDLLEDDYDKNNYKNKDRANYSYFNLEPATVTAGTLFGNLGYLPVYPESAPIKDFFNRQRFWAATDEKLTRVKNIENAGDLAENSMFSVVNLSKKPTTVFIAKASVIGYDMTIQEWYSLRFVNPSIPNFLHPDDMIADYFVDVIAIEGDWTNYSQLAGDPIYGQYFDKNGLVVNKINNFLQLQTVKVINRTVGSLIPDFQDAGGNVISIDRIFNNFYPTTEMIVALDKDKMEDVDLTESEFNSSIEGLKSYRIDTVGHGLYESDTNPNADTDDGGNFVLDDGDNIAIDYLSYKSPTSSKFKYDVVNVSEWVDSQIHEVTYKGIGTLIELDTIRAYEDSALYKSWELGYITNSMHLLNVGFEKPGMGTSPTIATYLKIVGPKLDKSDFKYIELEAYKDIGLSQKGDFSDSQSGFGSGTDEIYLHNTEMSEHSKIFNTLNSPVYDEGMMHLPEYNIAEEDAEDFAEFVKADNYILAKVSEGRRRVLKILSVTKTTEYPKDGVIRPTNVNATLTKGGELGDTTDSITYYYAVAAFDGTYWTTTSEEVSATIKPDKTPHTIVNIEWDDNPEVDKYRIYRGTKEGMYDAYEEIVGVSGYSNGSNDEFDLANTPAPDPIPDPPYATYHIEIQPSHSPNSLGIELDVNGDGSSTSFLVQKDITEYVTALNGIYLPGFKIREQVLPNGSSQRQEEIMEFVFDSGLAKAISDVETLDIRYIVDTYQGEITTNSKFSWGMLGAMHGKALVFVNDPSMKQFEEHNDPTFIDSTTGLINAKYIVEGGNRTLNPSYLYSLPNYSYNGVPIGTYMYFIGPNLLIRRNGKFVSVPPAVYASNVYIRRNKSGNKYGIPAVKRGLISEAEVVGVEYSYSDDERGELETNGHNLIVRKRRVGTMIFTDNTAYYRVESPLNSANNRDLLITIEKSIDLILFNYLYEFNDSIVQIRIKSAIGHYLNSIVAGGGLDYSEVIMDNTNNTPEIKRNNIGLIDIRIGFKDGIHKFINRISFAKSESGLSASPSGFKLL